MMEDLLRELELDANASWEDVQKAYRELLRVWHPDRFSEKDYLKEKAETKTRALNAAFEQLSKDWEQWEAAKKGGKYYRNRKPTDKQNSSVDTEAAIKAAKRTAALYVELRKTRRIRKWSRFLFWSAIFLVLCILGLHYYQSNAKEDSINFGKILQFISGSSEKEKSKKEYKPLNWRKIESFDK